jgi:soluble lytic murein transglycosylase-like protein
MLGGLGLAVLLFWQRKPVTGAVQSGVEDVQAAVQGWKTVNQGPVWIPVINSAELQQGIPTDLLARIAYQESRFRPDVIEGTTASGPGALGIMQLMPKYFSTVRVPRPFTPSDTAAQIEQAAAELTRLFLHYQDWALALAGYNDGQHNVDLWVAGNLVGPDGTPRGLPNETTNYVTEILADVPLAGATTPA